MDKLKKYWNNMLNNKFYIKGEKDSKTNEQVLASRDGNCFSPDACYFGFVKDLEEGTYYVDAN